MEAARAALARVGELFRRRRIAAELDEEMRYHLELEVRHNVARGMSPEDARRAALLAFGGVERFREETLEARGVVRLEALAGDLRLAVRRLRRAPAFTAAVVATLALSLGAAAGIGALVYGVMFRPLPYAEPERLARVDLTTEGLGLATTEHSPGTFVFFRERARSFRALEGYSANDGVAVTDGDAPERVTAAIVTPGMLEMLGVVPARGRLFRPEDGRGLFGPVLISHALWRRRYGGDPHVVGRTIELNRRPRLVAGVLPPGFDFPSRATAVYYADAVEAERASLGYRYLTVVGRLRPGATAESAERELAALAPRLPERYSELSADALQRAGLRVRVRPLRAAMAEPVRGELTLLGLMVGVILLIAAANVATLHLLRAERLRAEVAVSRALGASGWRIAQRFVAEGVVAALAGGAIALPLAAAAAATRFGFDAAQLPRLHEVRLTPALAALLLGVAAVMGALLGVAAAVRACGGDAAAVLRGAGRATPTRRWRRVQETLVAAQLAMALTLVLGAALMGGSLTRLRDVDIGFDARGASKFSLALPFRPYGTYQRVADFHLRLLDSLRAIPGVTGAAAAMQLPLTAQLLASHPRLEAARDDARPAQATATANVVTPDFFRVMRIPLLAGRTFAPGDLASAAPGVVLSASLARDLFGAASPAGREVRLASNASYPPYRVVGVVGDVYGDRIADGVLRVLYFPLLGDLPPASADTARIPYVPSGMHFVVRGPPLSALAPAFRRAVAAADARVPLWDVRTLDDVVAAPTARLRLTALLLGAAAGAALLLGAVGLYGVIAYAAAGRAPEFAVRLALGATPRAIVRLVMRQGAAVAAVGLAAGLALAADGARVLRGVLYGVSASDPTTYAAAAALVLAVALAASYLPARRAAGEDPARVLRAG
ncbi:MAG: ADOP family duplicated permease [Gemmatimonadaceae bacterium]